MNAIKDKEALYSWFASLYLRAPAAKLLQPFSDPEAISVLTSFFHDEPYQTALKELTAHIKQARLEDLRNEFDALFVVPSKRNYVPPYESCFREKRGNEIGNLWGETTADVARYYREAGYEAKNLQGIFAPDHIGVELAFIAKLCADEMQLIKNNNDSGQTKKIEELRKSFLREHLSKWIEDFSKTVNALPSALFYKNLSTLTAHMVHSDLKFVKEL